MKYTTVTDPVWNSEHTAVDCKVNFEGLGIVVFTASETDQQEYGREIYRRSIAGDFGPISDYVLDQTAQQVTVDSAKQIPITDTGAIL